MRPQEGWRERRAVARPGENLSPMGVLGAWMGGRGRRPCRWPRRRSRRAVHGRRHAIRCGHGSPPGWSGLWEGGPPTVMARCAPTTAAPAPILRGHGWSGPGGRRARSPRPAAAKRPLAPKRRGRGARPRAPGGRLPGPWRPVI
jgi:hypothetical protein